MFASCSLVGATPIYCVVCALLPYPFLPPQRRSVGMGAADFVDREKTGNTWLVGAMAIVRVTLRGGVYREDVGYGCSKLPSKAQGINYPIGV